MIRRIGFHGTTPPGEITSDALRARKSPLVAVLGWAIVGAVVGKIVEHYIGEDESEGCDDEYDAE